MVPRVVLASRSPQRSEILERLGVEFEAVVPEVEELGGGVPEVEILENALRKAQAVKNGAGKGALVIGCDTDVVIDGRAIGKPADRAQAGEHLALLSGRTHEVLSGLAIIGPGEGSERAGLVRSEVTFDELDSVAIDRYLASGEWRGRAGGYAIQGLGSTLVVRVEGDLANVIGLPIGLLLDLAPELWQFRPGPPA